MHLYTAVSYCYKKKDRSDKIRANIKSSSTFSGGKGELFQPNRVDVSILMKF